jgi:hypothetical protein
MADYTIGSQLFSGLGAGVSDIFGGLGAETKAAGDLLEGQFYGEAAQLALQNEQFTKESTAIQEAQANRELLMSTGALAQKSPAPASRHRGARSIFCARPPHRGLCKKPSSASRD